MRPRTPLSPKQVVDALEESGWDVATAASRLGVSARTLYRRMKEYGIHARVRYEQREAA